MGSGFQFKMIEEVLEMESDGRTTMWMHLRALNCTLKIVKMANFMSYIFYHKQR